MLGPLALATLTVDCSDLPCLFQARLLAQLDFEGVGVGEDVLVPATHDHHAQVLGLLTDARHARVEVRGVVIFILQRYNQCPRACGSWVTCNGRQSICASHYTHLRRVTSHRHAVLFLILFSFLV